MSDEFQVTNYILFDYIPNLVIPFLAGMLLIGMFTRFVKRGMDI